jgi:tripartite-type tricarboxylate transporter receptor subunit TctC
MLKLQALIVGVVMATGLAQPVRAQTYPSQNITVLVAFPAGGLADIIARLVSTKLEARLKQSVVVENRGGAGGNIAAKTVFTAARTATRS